MRNVYLTGAVRTPIGAFGGAFANVSAVTLGTASALESLKRSGVEAAAIGEVIVGNVLQAGQGQNPARQIALASGIAAEVPAFTVNKVCGSGLKALELAWQSIQLGRAESVLAGGTENMNMAPYIVPAMRQGARLGSSVLLDTVVFDGLTDIFSKEHMGITAENVAEKYGITRQEQDAFALGSQLKCAAAAGQQLFAAETVPVRVRQKKDEILIERDEYPKADTTLEKLAKLRPAFKEGGTVTAGNASGINDGAASAVVTARAPGSGSLDAVLIRDFAVCGCDPAYMGMGPVYAVRKLLRQNRLDVKDIDLWELNEAFAAQALAVLRELAVPEEKANVNGGAIALGHPIGASGARIAVTLIHQMKRQKASLGVAALCIGGGMGIALLVENC